MKLVYLLADPVDHVLVNMLADGLWRTEILYPTSLRQRDPSSERPKVGLVCIPAPEAVGPLQRQVRLWPDVDWIAIVSPASATSERVREFIAQFCVNYQTAPVDKERLLYALGHAMGMRNLLGDLRGPIRENLSALIIGESLAMRQLRRDLNKIASVDAPVLITGESGTGKELAAQTIHRQSARRDRPFIAVNCAALSPSLIHAELFGAERGAFTGAHARRIGQLEAADGGTVFLDEIGDLHPDLQALLLRFLEEKAVRRLGGHQQISVDARVIAATHVDLETAVQQKRFREDLYYRLNVLRVRIPALREHREDIEPLAKAFLARFADESPQRVTGFSRSALSVIAAHDWPGNVRELLNRVRRAIILADGRLVTAADMGMDSEVAASSVPQLETARTEAERQAVLAGLQSAAWNANKAAALLGVSRATLYRLLDKHQLSAEKLKTFVPSAEN